MLVHYNCMLHVSKCLCIQITLLHQVCLLFGLRNWLTIMHHTIGRHRTAFFSCKPITFIILQQRCNPHYEINPTTFFFSFFLVAFLPFYLPELSVLLAHMNNTLFRKGLAGSILLSFFPASQFHFRPIFSPDQSDSTKFKSNRWSSQTKEIPSPLKISIGLFPYLFFTCSHDTSLSPVLKQKKEKTFKHKPEIGMC